MDGVDDESWLLSLDVCRALVVDAARRLVSSDGLSDLTDGLQHLRAAVEALDKIEQAPGPSHQS